MTLRELRVGYPTSDWWTLNDDKVEALSKRLYIISVIGVRHRSIGSCNSFLFMDELDALVARALLRQRLVRPDIDGGVSEGQVPGTLYGRLTLVAHQRKRRGLANRLVLVGEADDGNPECGWRHPREGRPRWPRVHSCRSQSSRQLLRAQPPRPAGAFHPCYVGELDSWNPLDRRTVGSSDLRAVVSTALATARVTPLSCQSGNT